MPIRRPRATTPRLGGPEVPLILLCGEGFCSSLAAARLQSLGRDATDVRGGFDEWRDSGRLTVRGASSG